MPFEGDESEWDTLNWLAKQDYIPLEFTYDLPDERNNSFYFFISDNPQQFGYGWEDEFDDDPQTSWWDGMSLFQEEYLEIIENTAG